MQTIEAVRFEGFPNGFNVGDRIAFSMTDGEEIEAIAVRRIEGGMLFLHKDCLLEEKRMYERNDNRGGYENSLVRRFLLDEVLGRYPEEIRSRMMPLENGDLLRIPSEKEIFGRNEYGEEEPTEVEMFAPMAERRNRIAFAGKEGAWQYYWLMNRHRVSTTYFAYAFYNGSASIINASAAHGLRPVFGIRA